METPTLKEGKQRGHQNRDRRKGEGWCAWTHIAPPCRHREQGMLAQVHPHHSNRTVPNTTSTPLVCDKMAKRVRLARQEDEDSRARHEATNLGRIVENEAGKEDETEDDAGSGDERNIWSVAHVTEEDFETTEVRLRIYMTNSWRWQGGRSQTTRMRMRMTRFLLGRLALPSQDDSGAGDTEDDAGAGDTQ